jgi:DNA-binding MarR family transcriptional regulator
MQSGDKILIFPTPFHKAGLSLMLTANLLTERVNTVLKPYGISEQQYNVLRVLEGQRGNPINLRSIQERMIYKMSNTTRLVEKLKQKGLVERVICEDNRRMVEITITNEGIELLKYLAPIMKVHITSSFKNLNVKEAEKLTALLEKIRG